MPSSTGLSLVHGLLRVLIWLNILCLFLFLGLLGFILVAEDAVVRALAETHSPGRIGPLLTSMRLTLAIVVLVVPLAHLLLTRLRAMVATVAGGDPFVPENADRLTIIAWALLGIQFCDLGFGLVTLTVGRDVEGLEWSFGLTGWLAVALLFVLASVFRHGARMRDELAATV
jgi:hypothetical protein